jgi:hypothetical protein
LGSKGGQRWGDKKRGWQVSSAVIQSIFLFGASAILLSRPEEEPPDFQYWPGVIIMTAFSMGMQSIAAQKLVSPAFATVSPVQLLFLLDAWLIHICYTKYRLLHSQPP